MTKHSQMIRRFALSTLSGSVRPSFRLTLDGTQASAFVDAWQATRRFDETLGSSSDAELVLESLRVKRSAAARFRRVFGVAWPG